MSDTEWRIRFWNDEALKHTSRGDSLTASGEHDEAREAYWRASQALKTVSENTHNESEVAIIERSRAMLMILGGQPHVGEQIAAKQIAKGVASKQLAAEFRAIVRLAWKAQGITAKGDRAASDAFAAQRRRVRAALAVPVRTEDE